MNSGHLYAFIAIFVGALVALAFTPLLSSVTGSKGVV
jgi:hypothetical protein